MKNKDIIIIILLLALALVSSILIYFYFQDKNNKSLVGKTISSLEKYKNIVVDDITSIEVSYQSEILLDEVVITDKDKIKEVFNMLGDIKFEKETDLFITDDGMIIQIVTDEGNTSFSFDANIVTVDNIRYETIGINNLKILIQQEEA